MPFASIRATEFCTPPTNALFLELRAHGLRTELVERPGDPNHLDSFGLLVKGLDRLPPEESARLQEKIRASKHQLVVMLLPADLQSMIAVLGEVAAEETSFVDKPPPEKGRDALQ